MWTVITGLGRDVARGSAGTRLAAVLPLALLAGFWAAGESFLLAAAVGAPVVLGVVGLVRRGTGARAGKFGADPLSRSQLSAWLDAGMGQTGRRGQMAVLTIAIDDMPSIETRFGRDGRAAVRRGLAERLREQMRQDDEVAALDDTMFAIGLRSIRAPETETLLHLARRLQSLCDEPFSDGAARIFCTASLGLAAERHVSRPTGEALVAAAERAGDFAAACGPGSVRIFSEGLASDQKDVRERARTLSDALETGEIFAWFQPQMSADGETLTGFEALARWDRAEDGVAAPGAFLPDIQKAGLSQRLTEVILKQALTALNAWDAAGFDVKTVSVNFSGEELRNPELADYVMWELERFGLPPERLVVEVLESVIADHHEDAITRTLLALSRSGCRIDLDDFGAGFTGILNIRRFNVSRIKIDRQLVSRLDRDKDQRRMVSALLSFSRKLGIEALAEGVETQAERRVLQRMGCPLIQGYVAAKPMPLGETLNWLDMHEAGSGSRGANATALSA
ncbi:MAG: bifunctional diguanylate cyclase/phosphodiesterase [Silicimonas sp.]|nr:bifunctional diguanylate cyclase/phosphodiesterase [Silicimonas sp.]